MRIGVLSDTHAHSFIEIPKRILEVLSTVDFIIHAGDFVTVEVFEGLRQLGELKAVHGNMDSYQLKSMLPKTELIIVGDKRIGITHGSGTPWGIEHRVKQIFANDNVDVIIYGHSHVSQNEVSEGILFFNPGQARNSFGILTVEEDVKGEIIKL